MYNISVLGAGTWGIALAKLLASNNHHVTVWSPSAEKAALLAATHRHPRFETILLPEEMEFTNDLEQACQGMELIVVAVSSVYVRQVAARMTPFLQPGQTIVDVAKGIEAGSLLSMSQVIASETSKRPELAELRIVALSGPTHAEEVIQDLPSAIVSASSCLEAAQLVQQVFSNDSMRVYVNQDVAGVELCGAMKNIIALGSGLASGLGYGDNARAAIITRGMAEISRLGLAMGCEEHTFLGLAGMGDLIVTATSRHSRNFNCGMLIGQGVPPQQAIEQVGMVVEGVNALPAAMELLQRYGVEMPIAQALNAIVHGGAQAEEIANRLMQRDQKAEYDPGY